MANPFKTQEFNQLFNEWNSKLKESGFIDAENFALPVPQLKVWHNLEFNKVSPEEIKQADEYTKRATRVLWHYSFESKTHRTIWELHAEGKSIRQITALVNLPGFSRNQIHVYIVHMKRINGLKRD